MAEQKQITVTLTLTRDEGPTATLEELRRYFRGNDGELVGTTYFVDGDSGEASYTCVSADVTEVLEGA